MVGGSLLQACLDGRIWNGTTPCCGKRIIFTNACKYIHSKLSRIVSEWCNGFTCGSINCKQSNKL